MKPARCILKRGHELRNSLAGRTGKTFFGAGTTTVDKHQDHDIPHGSCLSIHVFWLEDAPINTSNTIYVIYTLRKAYHILSNLSVN